MGVLAIWRYPVKAMLGELLEAVKVGPSGCAGDRRWIVVDAETGERIANKRGPTDPRLRSCRAELLDDSDEQLPLRVTLPDGDTLDGSEIQAGLSELLERRVRLEMSKATAPGRLGATGAHHDLAPVHLVTTSTLKRFRTAAPECDWDVRRFRPNLLLDDDALEDRFAEDVLLGGRLASFAGLTLKIGLPTPRCVVPTRAQQGLPADPRILRAVVENHRVDLGPFGRQGCLGAYAEVVRDGDLNVGERLDVLSGSTTSDDAISAAIDRLVEELGNAS